MAIKTWPYGGKPSIAVAKETKASLLTVGPLKLRGAVTPVEPGETNRDSEGKTEAESIMSSAYCLCMATLPQVAKKVLEIQQGFNFNMLAVFIQRGKKKSFLINELFVLA